MDQPKSMLRQVFIKLRKMSLLIGMASLVITAGCSGTNTNASATTPGANSSPSSTSTNPQHYALSVSIIPSGSGAVSVIPPGGAVAPGEKVTLIASAVEGYRFDHWGSNTSATSSTLIITMDSNKQISAYFESTTVPLSAPSISQAEAKSILDTNPTAVFVDVRLKPDYDKGHISGAISVPFGELENKYSEIAVGPQVIVYSQCH